ncbi:hypothetical protein [Pararhizobium haloflavum]|uniref:hypothetical protein n=1 Tax=Pararhizobium haloflavum TaxID=2037914 RepID=UPI000C17F103|nr:hypothetical protein [Pararhizobium haloflavum]
MAFENWTEMWKEMGQQIQLLTVSGIAGAFFRAVLAPEKETRKRIVQGVAGAISAVFLGGIVANVINSFMDGGAYAYLAAGFIMGSGGEVAVKAFQDRVFGEKKS